MARELPKELENYIQVKDRVQEFYKDHPKGRIHTKILELNVDKVVFQARVWRNDNGKIETEFPDATGHAEEIRGQGYVNKTSALENSETSAVGRALALLGYKIEKDIASREEMQAAANEAEVIDKPSTAPQQSRIYTMLSRLQLKPSDYEKRLGKSIESLSLSDANDIISRLMAAVEREQAEKAGKAEAQE